MVTPLLSNQAVGVYPPPPNHNKRERTHIKLMKKFLKNKFFIAALAVALALTVSTTVLSVMGISDPLRNIFGTLTAPLRWCAAKISQGLDGYKIYFQSIEALVEQNNALAAENAELREQLADARLSEAQAEYFRDYLGLPWLENDWSLTDATVIGRESTPYRTTYTLSRGSLHGIKKGMPVVTDRGVVGSVVEVGLGYCRVSCIIETASKVGVYVKRSGADGILAGDMKLRADGLCRMTNLSADADIMVGDLIVTAGTGSIYPAELTVGVVTELIPDEFSRTLTAVVRPAADLEDLRTVMIINEYTVKPYTYDDIDPTLTPESTQNDSSSGEQGEEVTP